MARKMARALDPRPLAFMVFTTAVRQAGAPRVMFHRDRLPDPVDYYTAEGFTLVGRGKWRTMACPFHGSSDSMRVNTDTGSFVCMSLCGARGGDVVAFHQAHHGVGFVQAARDLGAWTDDPRDPAKPRRRPTKFSAADALEVCDAEMMVVIVAALGAHDGVPLTDADKARLLLAAKRLHTVWQWWSDSR